MGGLAATTDEDYITWDQFGRTAVTDQSSAEVSCRVGMVLDKTTGSVTPVGVAKHVGFVMRAQLCVTCGARLFRVLQHLLCTGSSPTRVSVEARSFPHTCIII